MSTLISTELRYSGESEIKLTPARPGLLKSLLKALMESRQRQAEREVERYIQLYGGRMTDDVERRIEQRLMRG